ncbi:hypothetical protein KC845_01825 [Candidatus Kaiserbacteria bacterium]|nr:hypothetical protein [Candidatus Kaiserbacteria bacterium]
MSPLILKNQSFNLRHILKAFFVFLLALGLVVYTAYQARFILAGPQISITDQLSSAQTDRVIILEGRANNIVYMTLNGRQIYTDQDGYFKESLVLENGYTVSTLRAKDRYGHEVSVRRSFVYLPTETEENQEAIVVLNE